MDTLAIGTILFHPCSIDILQYRVSEITCSENGVSYLLTNHRPIGIHCRGELKVIVQQNQHNQIWFCDVVGTEDSWTSGLQDFVEGRYFSSEKDAQKEYRQKLLYRLKEKRDTAKRFYEQAQDSVDKVEAMLKSIGE